MPWRWPWFSAPSTVLVHLSMNGWISRWPSCSSVTMILGRTGCTNNFWGIIQFLAYRREKFFSFPWIFLVHPAKVKLQSNPHYSRSVLYTVYCIPSCILRHNFSTYLSPMIPEEDPLLGNRTLFLLIVIELVLIFLISIFEFYWDVLGFQLISFPSLGFFYFLSVEKWKTSKPISCFSSKLEHRKKIFNFSILIMQPTNRNFRTRYFLFHLC